MLPALLLACSSPSPDSGGTITDTAGPRQCNGHVELCDVAFDRVTLPGTHNSMSNADAGWLAPNQQHGLTRQLDDGVRAMMLDTHMWNDEPYLCHGYCELGSQPLDEGLAEVARFMDAHPDEVLTIIFEDNVSASVTAEVMESVGLTEHVATAPSAGEPWPTLGQMIDSGGRLVTTAQNEGPPPEWYANAWMLYYDTPYSFVSAEDFSCALNRGSSDNPLFLVNHWVADPLPVEDEAAAVNAADVLGARARECVQAWDRPITFLAVDFYAVGDLFAVVDELNGVR